MKKINDIASLYNLYVDHLYTYALYLGFDKETIMDAIHDVFCKLAADQKKLHDVSNIKLYLFRALKNRLYDIFKTRREYVGLSIIESQEMPFFIKTTELIFYPLLLKNIKNLMQKFQRRRKSIDLNPYVSRNFCIALESSFRQPCTLICNNSAICS